MAKLSIIVPVYNAEKYLDQCVKSILAQTFPDFELVLVNDGSTDSSAALCGDWAAKDMRVKVIHKPNGRASSARNAGSRRMRTTTPVRTCPSRISTESSMKPSVRTGSKHKKPVGSH